VHVYILLIIAMFELKIIPPMPF